MLRCIIVINTKKLKKKIILLSFKQLTSHLKLHSLLVVAVFILVFAGFGSRLVSKSHAATILNTSDTTSMLQGLKEISYYPSVHSWNGMWYVWDPTPINTDFTKIQSLGANTVRIFIQPSTFGYPTPSSQYLNELNQVITMASAHGLKVHLTLFDEWSSYTDINGSLQWAQAILQPYFNDPRIAIVELQNEIDPTNSSAISWAQTMLPAVRNDSGKPVTVSVTGWNSTITLSQLIQNLGSVQPDLYDDHFYGNLEQAQAVFRSAKNLAKGVPLLVGETGYSTDTNNNSIPGVSSTTTAHEQYQSYYFYWIEEIAKNENLPLIPPWTLNDFVGSQYVNATEQHFGLYRLDGSAKPAAQIIQSIFMAASNSTMLPMSSPLNPTSNPNPVISSSTASNNATQFQSNLSSNGNRQTLPLANKTVGNSGPPTLSSLNISKLTNKAVVISWKTDVPANSIVSYGLTPRYGLILQDTSLSNSHRVTISESLLKLGGSYYVMVDSSVNGLQGTPLQSRFTLPGFDITVRLSDTHKHGLAGIKVTLPTGVSKTTNRDGKVYFTNVKGGQQTLALKGTNINSYTVNVGQLEGNEQYQTEFSITAQKQRIMSTQLILAGVFLVTLSLVVSKIMLNKSIVRHRAQLTIDTSTINSTASSHLTLPGSVIKPGK